MSREIEIQELLKENNKGLELSPKESEPIARWWLYLLAQYLSSAQCMEEQKKGRVFPPFTSMQSPYSYQKEAQEIFFEFFYGRKEDFAATLLSGWKRKSLLEDIASGTKKLLEHSETQRMEHADIIEQCKRLEVLLRKQIKDNERLRRLLNRAYPIKRLSVIAGAMLFASVASLLGTALYSVEVVHPAISIIGVLASVSFLFLARWRTANVK